MFNLLKYSLNTNKRYFCNNFKNDLIRNIAIIAHVDHGKTTFVDCLLRESGYSVEDRSMDKNELEKEKGITITSKVTSVTYKNHLINIVDTPGHQDFGGEVERVLSLVDGVFLLVCSTEGVMKQTKYVVKKAVENNLIPTLIVNKIDRVTSRIEDVENEVFDLFCNNNIKDDYLDYKTFYTSAVKGLIFNDHKNQDNVESMKIILDHIINNVPHPKENKIKGSSLFITNIDYNSFYGKLIKGKLLSGSIKIGDIMYLKDENNNIVEKSKINKIYRSIGLVDKEIESANYGEIISIAGFEKGKVNYSLFSEEDNWSFPVKKIDPPLFTILLFPSISGLAGKNGHKCSFNEIFERLKLEEDLDIALQIEKKNNNTILIKGRGDLHLGLLLEKLRREKFDFCASSPKIISKTCKKTNKLMEPIEELIVDIEINGVSFLMDKLNNRFANIIDTIDSPDGKQKFICEIPSRGLLGLKSEINLETNFVFTMENSFLKYDYYLGMIKKNHKSALVSSCEGKVSAYALKDLEKHGIMFIKPGDNVIKGQVVGQSKLGNEMVINCTKEKKVTNVRSVTHDDLIKLTPPKVFSLEEILLFLKEDEKLEIASGEIRIMKIELDDSKRRKQKKENLDLCFIRE